jgi:vacuolar-type H+-ATPase subunit H
MRSLDLIHQIAHLVVHSFKIPVMHYSVIPEDPMLDLIEELEATLPQEFKEAAEVAQEREKILAEARKEAEEILNQAKLNARSLLSDNEVYKAAQSEIERMRQDLAAESSKSQSGADRYADEVLSDLEAKIGRALATVQNGRQQLNIS